MAFEVLIFNGDDGIAEHGRNIVVSDNNSPLQRERSNLAAVNVVEQSCRVGPVALEINSNPVNAPNIAARMARIPNAAEPANFFRRLEGGRKSARRMPCSLSDG